MKKIIFIILFIQLSSCTIPIEERNFVYSEEEMIDIADKIMHLRSRTFWESDSSNNYLFLNNVDLKDKQKTLEKFSDFKIPQGFEFVSLPRYSYEKFSNGYECFWYQRHCFKITGLDDVLITDCYNIVFDNSGKCRVMESMDTTGFKAMIAKNFIDKALFDCALEVSKFYYKLFASQLINDMLERTPCDSTYHIISRPLIRYEENLWWGSKSTEKIKFDSPILGLNSRLVDTRAVSITIIDRHSNPVWYDWIAYMRLRFNNKGGFEMSLEDSRGSDSFFHEEIAK
jgi:hypothetical protein